MPKQYINRAYIDINGLTLADFNHVEEEQIPNAKQVALMFSTGYAKMTKRFKINVDYVRPVTNPIDWLSFADEGTIHMVREGGEETVWTGCTVETIGAITYNGEGEAVQKITFICETRDGDRGDGNA